MYIRSPANSNANPRFDIIHLSIPFTNIYISNDIATAIPIPDKKDTNTENIETKTTFFQSINKLYNIHL